MQRKTSFPARRLACAALLCALFAGAAGAQTTVDAASAFDSAMADYERNHWDQAYAAFTALADQGQAEAARLALQMWQYGPALYQRAFAANAHQLARWARVWRCGSENAPAQACQLALRTP